MNRKEFVQKKINILKQTMSSFQLWSFILFGIALASFVISFIVASDKSVSMELLKYGLSSLSVISGGALQGVKFARKNKLVELEYCVGLVDNYETLQAFEKKIVDAALEK
jgi:hypothetical protein